MWKGMGFPFEQTLNSLYQGMLFAKFGWNWQSGSGEDFLLKSSMYFHSFIIIFPWKKEWSFIKTRYLNSLIQGWLVLSLVEIGPVVLENDILKIVNVFWQFRNYCTLEKDRALHFNKLEWPKDDLLAQRFLSRRFLKYVYAFLLFLNYFPLLKGEALYLMKP